MKLPGSLHDVHRVEGLLEQSSITNLIVLLSPLEVFIPNGSTDNLQKSFSKGNIKNVKGFLNSSKKFIYGHFIFVIVVVVIVVTELIIKKILISYNLKILPVH